MMNMKLENNKNNINKAYAEVYEIINLLGAEYRDKIPAKVIDFLQNNKDDNYIVILDPEIPLEDQCLLKDTINILALIKKDYWCDSKEERDQFFSILRENEKKSKEKYSIDKLFNNKKNEQDYEQTQPENEKSLWVITENKKWYNRIFKFLKSFLGRKI